MKEITLAENVFHIVSEPGDATRYDYLVIKTGYHFRFVGYKSTFPFPHSLYYHQAIDITTLEEAISWVATNKSDINPHTILECAKTAVELFNTYKDTI